MDLFLSLAKSMLVRIWRSDTDNDAGNVKLRVSSNEKPRNRKVGVPNNRIPTPNSDCIMLKTIIKNITLKLSLKINSGIIKTNLNH